MPTPYSTVFAVFFEYVKTDTIYFLLPEKDAYEKLTLLMNMSITEFRRPRISLDRDDASMTFDNQLTWDEIDVIGFLMAHKWLMSELTNAELPLHRDKDYNPRSVEAKLIQKFQELDKLKREKLVTYTRKIGCFKPLAGKEVNNE